MTSKNNNQNKRPPNTNNKSATNSDTPKNPRAPKGVYDFLDGIDKKDTSYKSVNLGLTLYRYQWDIKSAKRCVPYLLKDLSCFLPEDKNKSSQKGQSQTSTKDKNKTCLDSTELYPGQMKPLLATLSTRTQTLAQSFPAHVTINYHPQTRLILGADSDTPYSNVVLLKLHQLYGLPYLSASSIKGSFRNFWILSYFGGNEAVALKDTTFRQLFGASDDDGAGIGALVFFDTFPKKFSLTLDIQTPHYQKYYAGSEPPTDTQSPVPIYLLCLTDCQFDIALACQDAALWQDEREKILQTFKALLTDYGLGAKTALGYGIGTAEKKS